MASVEEVGKDSEHILELELMRFFDGLHVREIINESKVSDLNHKKREAAND